MARESPRKPWSALLLHQPTGWYVDPDLGYVYTAHGTWEGRRIGAPNPRGTWRATRKHPDGTLAYWRLPYVVWEAVEGRPVPDKHMILHRNGDKDDLRAANLECVSVSEGRRRLALASARRGQDNEQALLTNAEARAIRNSKDTPTVLAQRYGVAKATVDSIRSGHSWRHLTRPSDHDG
jgi:hypothetical protein